MQLPIKYLNLTSLPELMNHYDLFLFDIWGVIVEGDRAYPKVVEAINYVIDHKKVVFVSNMPRTTESTCSFLRSYGINSSKDMIITAGALARKFLASPLEYMNLENLVLYNFGFERHKELWHGLDVRDTEVIHDANLIVISKNVPQKEVDDSSYDLLREAARLNISAICANNDRIAALNGEIVYCAGHFAERFEEFGGNVWYMGKPFSPIFEEAIRMHHGVAKKRVLMIGDTVDTDIVGAMNVGIDSALVTTGNIGLAVKNDDDKLLAMSALCTKLGVFPNHIINLSL